MTGGSGNRAPMAQLAGKTILVTGASSGLGLQVAIQLARLGGEVVMTSRDEKRGEVALSQAKARSSSKAISLMLCDFASQADVRKFASAWRAHHQRLDVLVNNAGSVSPAR